METIYYILSGVPKKWTGTIGTAPYAVQHSQVSESQWLARVDQIRNGEGSINPDEDRLTAMESQIYDLQWRLRELELYVENNCAEAGSGS